MEATKKNEQAFAITGNWATQSEQLKKEFPSLTDADLKFETGKEEDLLKRMETRLNKQRDEVVGIIKQTEPVKENESAKQNEPAKQPQPIKS
jgi:hypothetical protein